MQQNDNTMIRVESNPFQVEQLTDWLSHSPKDGAIVTFTGKVRGEVTQIKSLYLEHYQGMTERVLEKIVQQARERWLLNRIVVIHRIGEILTNESIVFVGASSAHRKDAFEATEFIMDHLKNEAPFWKKEKTVDGDNWVAVKKADEHALKKWS